MNDRSEGFAIIEMILQSRVPRVGTDATLNPCVAGDSLCLRQTEVFHDSKTFRVGTELRMPKAAARILIRISKYELITDRILLQESERVADADIVIRFGK